MFGEQARKFCRPYLRDTDAGNAARQLTRASAAVGAAYRSACVSRSHDEFISRIAHTLEEADECKYWTRYLRNGGLESKELVAILNESAELACIFSASLTTAMSRPPEERRPPNRTKKPRKK
ncbi:MAG TPA: four helix bundle protein [Vicinamibacterales bacterium]|nr:four helix bundle protein [Vicinamibacterales bacterium]